MNVIKIKNNHSWGSVSRRGQGSSCQSCSAHLKFRPLSLAPQPAGTGADPDDCHPAPCRGEGHSDSPGTWGPSRGRALPPNQEFSYSGQGSWGALLSCCPSPMWPEAVEQAVPQNGHPESLPHTREVSLVMKQHRPQIGHLHSFVCRPGAMLVILY